MKRITLYFLASMLVFSQVFAKTKTLPPPGHVVPFTSVDTQLINELIAGIHPDLVIECREGTELPISYLHNNVFFSAFCSPNLSIKVEKTCYLRFVKKKVYMSDNLTEWNKPSKYLEGRYTAAMKIDQDSGILVETKVVPYTVDELTDLYSDDEFVTSYLDEEFED